MLKKKQFVFLMLPLILILAACASLKLPGAATGASTSVPQGQNQQPGQPPDMSKQPVEQKLAIGTLKLEGTDKAVTAEQAKALLPLWKAVKSLSSDSKTAPAEIDALYKQIQESMSAEQVDAIKNMSLAREDTQALIDKYGIKMPQMGAGFPGQNGTPPARSQTGGNSGSTGNSGRNGRSQPGGGFPGGDMGGPGMMPGGGGFPGGMPPNAQGTPNAQRTPRAGMPNGGFRGGMNTMFIDPLITILSERAGVPITPTVQVTPTAQ